MTWFRADDGLPDHPKVLELADTRSYKAAMGLWVLAGCWSSKHLTDGAVPKSVVKRLGFAVAEATALVECGLWAESDTGYQFHDWQQCNPLRADVEAKREATAARVKRHRNKPTAPPGNGGGNALHDASRNTVGNDAPVPARPGPSRPDHDPTDRSARVRLGFAKRYERLRGGLTWPSGKFDRQCRELAAWFAANPSVSLETALDNFFADPWALSADFPFGALAKSPAKYAAPPELPDPDAKARAKSREREATLADIDRQMRGEA